MKNTRNAKWMGVLLVAGLVALAGCNSTNLDDGSGPDVVLEIQNMTVTPVTTAADNTGNCTFTVTESTVNFLNKPKNALAASEPFNDILMRAVTISYEWDDGVVSGPATFPLSVAVPVGGSGTDRFLPVTPEILFTPGPSSPDRAGHSAAMTMLFEGRTVEGTNVQTDGGATLFVNSCVQTEP